MGLETFDLEQIQKAIRQNKNCDGWLLYDFHGHNSIALDILCIKPTQILSRRFFYWIPKSGLPTKLVHQVEDDSLDHLPGKKELYDSWESLETKLAQLMEKKRCVAMEHAPDCKIPIISKLDSGTFEWLTKRNITIISSWPIAESFLCRLDKKQQQSHKSAAKLLIKAYKSAWNLVEKALKARKKITEYDVQQHIMETIEQAGYMSSIPPIVAVDANAALPHYLPSKKSARQIKENMLLLIDLSAKLNSARSIFSDLTQVAFIGKNPPQELVQRYAIVYEAQKQAIDFLSKRCSQKKPVTGSELDDVCRAVLCRHNLGKYFVHRTGHNIYYDMHGLGPNLDNFETCDTRELLPRTCYSIEPGIYFPGAYGIRLECNIFINDEAGVEVTAPSSPHLVCLKTAT